MDKQQTDFKVPEGIWLCDSGIPGRSFYVLNGPDAIFAENDRINHAVRLNNSNDNTGRNYTLEQKGEYPRNGLFLLVEHDSNVSEARKILANYHVFGENCAENWEYCKEYISFVAELTRGTMQIDTLLLNASLFEVTKVEKQKSSQ